MSQLTLSGRTICLVDDDELVRQAISLKLREQGLVVLEASSGPELYDLLERRPLDCVLLDYELAHENGLFVQEQLRKRFLEAPPVIMLTATDNHRTIIKAFRTGVHDYLIKSGLRSEDLVQSIRTAIMQHKEHLASQAELTRLKNRTAIDETTGLYRREFVDEELANLVDVSAGAGKTFSIILIRMNNLDAIQVQAGQVAAKRALTTFATHLRKVISSNDVCGRDEAATFICLVDTASNRKELAALIERLSGALTFDFRQETLTFAVGASFGLASFPSDGATSESLLHSARQSLEQAGSEKPHKAELDAVDLGSEPASTERRRHARQRVLKGGKIMMIDGPSVFDCMVRDLSVAGARLKLTTPFSLPEVFDLRIAGSGRDQRSRVAWQQGADVGVEFVR